MSYEFLHTYATAAPRLLLQLPRHWLQLAGASAAQLCVDFAGLLLCTGILNWMVEATIKACNYALQLANLRCLLWSKQLLTNCCRVFRMSGSAMKDATDCPNACSSSISTVCAPAAEPALACSCTEHTAQIEVKWQGAHHASWQQQGVQAAQKKVCLAVKNRQRCIVSQRYGQVRPNPETGWSSGTDCCRMQYALLVASAQLVMLHNSNELLV